MLQVAPEIEKLETAVARFPSAAGEGVMRILFAASDVNDALAKVLGKGHVPDSQAPAVGDKIIRLFVDLKWLKENYSSSFSEQVTQQLFFSSFNLSEIRQKDQFVKALGRRTEELSPEVFSWVKRQPSAAPDSPLAKLLKLCIPILNKAVNKRGHEGGAAGGPSTGEAPSKVAKAM